MRIRTASSNSPIQKNGTRRHLTVAIRVHSPRGADAPPSPDEQALREERRLLKEARVTRQARARLPTTVTSGPVKVATPPKDTKAAKGDRPLRAKKLTMKAGNLEAAKKAERKSAET